MTIFAATAVIGCRRHGASSCIDLAAGTESIQEPGRRQPTIDGCRLSASEPLHVGILEQLVS
jgi:hypothetical protein